MPEPAPITTWNDYFIPGSAVLRNKFTSPEKPYGEDDPVVLRRREELAAAFRLVELADQPVVGKFDYDHLKAIHRYIFQDVYHWAGEERVAPVDRFMTKDGFAYYPAGPELTRAASRQFDQLSRKKFLRGLPHELFVEELAEIWGELNVIHSFREGNTRAQYVFFSQLCEQAGYLLDPHRFANDPVFKAEFVAARFYSQSSGTNGRLAEVLRHVVH